jgi:hypothetical protein
VLSLLILRNAGSRSDILDANLEPENLSSCKSHDLN